MQYLCYPTLYTSKLNDEDWTKLDMSVARLNLLKYNFPSGPNSSVLARFWSYEDEFVLILKHGKTILRTALRAKGSTLWIS